VLTADFLAAEDKLWLMQQLGPCVPQHSSTAVVGVGSGDASTQSQGGAVTAAAGCGDAAEAEEQEKGQLCAAAACEGHEASSTSNNSPMAAQQGGRECLNGIVGDMQQQAGQQSQAAPTQQQQQQQHMDSAGLKPAGLSAGQQLLLTFKNRLIWYLMLLKALKVRGRPTCGLAVVQFCCLPCCTTALFACPCMAAALSECSSAYHRRAE